MVSSRHSDVTICFKWSHNTTSWEVDVNPILLTKLYQKNSLYNDIMLAMGPQGGRQRLGFLELAD